jgi:DNA polymerase (family 10)
VRAYRNAARVAGGMSQSLADLVARGEDLTRLPGVGRDLAGKIVEIAKTGDLGLLKELEARTPPAWLLMNVAGLGPKGCRSLREHYHRGLRKARPENHELKGS